jgi:hypothetical protein
LRPSQQIPFWLLDRPGLDAAFTGDILEEWEQGQSTIWYWRQILSAVRVAIWKALVDHKLLAVQMVTGWVVARTHRTHPVPMVTAFAIFLLLWAILLGSADSYLRMLLVDSLDQPRFRPHLLRYLALISIALFLELVGLYSGGILGTGRRRVSEPAPQ